MRRSTFLRSHTTRLFLILGILLFTAGGALAAEFQAAPLNPEFLKYREKARTLDIASLRQLGHMPSPLDLSHVRGSVFEHQDYPAAYDLRNVEGRNYVTPVRNQNPYGTCWAFAALGSLESTVLRSTGGTAAGTAATTPDYSEWHLSYFAYIDQSASLPGFKEYTTADLPYIFDAGGEDWKAAALLARWTGAVEETSAPYGESYPTGNEAAQCHLEHAYYLPSPAQYYSPINTTDLKYIISTYGGVSIGMYVSDNMSGNIDGGEWNPSTAAYYYKGEESSNHGVTAVGWDDNYSASNFNAAQRPPGNGAWIVKNSWGTSWGDDGYLYISYYDEGIEGNIAFVGTGAQNYDYVYQYDPLGWVNAYGYDTETAWFANVFTAGSGLEGFSVQRTAGPESLEAISFYSAAINSSYEISVYTNVVAGPDTGTRVFGPQSGTLQAPGYHTVRLDSAVSLAPGTKFAVAVKLTTPGYSYPIPLEQQVAWHSPKASANPGESYISTSGVTWTDLTTLPENSESNVALKAFTQKSSEPTPTPTSSPVNPTVTSVPTITATPSSGGGGGCSLGFMPLVMLLALPLTLLRK